ncbi:MAG: hypothetical protein JWN40_417 [Phycisphaerales bacterium]|nr:hypothetical protein [Phycisphaerales bacterium]
MTALEIVSAVIGAFNQLGVPYMLVGSFSSNFYGRPRSTKDADFVVEIEHQTLSALTALLGSDFELDSQMTFETITGTMRYRLHHKAAVFMVELFELSTDPHDQMRFSRRIKTPFASHDAFVPTAEDVVITKLRWSKHGQRAKDIEDVQNVLNVQSGKLDLPYIRHWCDLHATRDLFERLLQAVPA